MSSASIKPRILIVDDNPAIHEDIRKILCPDLTSDPAFDSTKALLFGDEPSAGIRHVFEIDSAYQGEEAIDRVTAALAEGRPYAVAFVDMRMPPGMDGIETIARLWEVTPLLQTVICTAYADYTWEEMMGKLGRSDRLLILKKPFDNLEVLQLAHALSEKWHLARELRHRIEEQDRLVEQRTAELREANERIRREMTERFEVERQLRHVQKMEAIGQLAAGVAHDFNNNLTVILGHADLLAAGRDPAAPEMESIRMIGSAAERAGRLVRQLLTFSRKQPADFRSLNLVSTLSSLAEMLPRVLGEHIEVRLLLPPALATVRADGGMIDQMLLNLAVNARDAMPDGGVLTIAATSLPVPAEMVIKRGGASTGDYVRISVSDTGHGIPPAILPRIFEPFFTTKPVGQGTGLGLATAYGIAKQHGGWIEVHSDEGKGADFHIYLPALALPEGVKTSRSASPYPRGGTETVFVVEDDEKVRQLAERILRANGYQVLVASSGVEALEIWPQRKERIHLLLTDIMMPGGVSGRDLAAKLRAEDRTLSVIYTTGYSASLEDSGEELDPTHFLPKPYGPAQLLATVRACLDTPA